MSRRIKAIERHMILPVQRRGGSHLGPQSTVPPVRSQTRCGEFGLQSRAAKLVAEWQQHGPETLSGHAVRKLRLAFVPTSVAISAHAAG